MSEPKWTKGPWFLFGNGHCVGGPADTESGTGGVAMCGMNIRTPEESAANAQLTVTAPEMYEALEQAEIALINCVPLGWTPGQDFVGREEFNPLQVIRAVMAKARGEL